MSVTEAVVCAVFLAAVLYGGWVLVTGRYPKGDDGVDYWW